MVHLPPICQEWEYTWTYLQFYFEAEIFVEKY